MLKKLWRWGRLYFLMGAVSAYGLTVMDGLGVYISWLSKGCSWLFEAIFVTLFGIW